MADDQVMAKRAAERYLRRIGASRKVARTVVATLPPDVLVRLLPLADRMRLRFCVARTQHFD